MSTRALIVDVETTGLDPVKDEIVELALIHVVIDIEGNIIPTSIDEYTGLREPSCPIPPAATEIHGLSVDDVAGHKLDEQRILAMLARSDLCIAHNVGFDRPFLEKLFPQFKDIPWRCTMRDINWYRLGIRSRRLSNLTRYFGIAHDHAHRALADARATLRLLSVKDNDGGPLYFHLIGPSYHPAQRHAQ